MNSDFTSAAKDSLLQISKFFNNKFHFFLPHPKHSPLRIKNPYLWPRSKCWIRASRASIQHAATKVTNKDSFILRGRLFCLWQITYPCLCLGTVFFTGSFVVRNCTAIPSTHNASVSAALEFSEESVVIPIYFVTPGSSPAAEVPHTIAEVSIMTGAYI